MQRQEQPEQRPSSSFFCPCGSNWHGIHGGEGKGHTDDLNLVASSLFAPTLFFGSTFGIATNDNTKDDRSKEERGWVMEIEHNT
jgi:hypothetical protein